MYRPKRQIVRIDYSELNSGSDLNRSPASQSLPETSDRVSPELKTMATGEGTDEVAPDVTEEQDGEPSDISDLHHSSPGSASDNVHSSELDRRECKIEQELIKYERKRIRANRLKMLKEKEAALSELRHEVHHVKLETKKLVKKQSKPTADTEKVSKRRTKKPKSSTSKSSKKGGGASSSDVEIDVNDLREMETLTDKAEKTLKKFGLGYTSSSDADEESDADIAPPQQTKKGKGTKKVKSGLEAKASRSVIAPMIHPQSVLQLEYVNKELDFKELDFRLYVAGETEILSSDLISADEKKTRLWLLKKMAYYLGIYEWAALQNLYVACLRKIELGLATWSSLPELLPEMELPLLAGAVKQKKGKPQNPQKSRQFGQPFSKKSTKKDDRSFFCSAYNRGTCSFPESHVGEREGTNLERALSNRRVPLEPVTIW
jgi:hypothetical protein